MAACTAGLSPSFETSPSKSGVADFDASDCRSRASPTSVGASQDEGLHFFTRSFAGDDTCEGLLLTALNKRLGALLTPPVDQSLDLGQASRDPIHLGLQPNDALELRRCDLHLPLQLADAGPQIRCAPGGHDSLADDGHDERERHLLVEMPLPVFSLAHVRLTGSRCPARKARPR